MNSDSSSGNLLPLSLSSRVSQLHRANVMGAWIEEEHHR